MLVISAIEDIDKRNYLRARVGAQLRLLTAGSEGLESEAYLDAWAACDHRQLVRPEQLQSLDECSVGPELRRTIAERFAKHYPLTEGETESSLTFFAAPAEAAHHLLLGEYGIVVEQQTNLARCFYLFDLRGLAPVEQSAGASPAQVVAEDIQALDPVTAAILSKIGAALLSTIVSRIATEGLNLAFPVQLPGYFNQVYAKIAEIVKDEIDAAVIEKTQAWINGEIGWVRNTFLPRKRGGAPLRDLHDMLVPRQARLRTELLATLLADRWATMGIQVFGIAAGANLSVIQELALVDPLVDDPNASSWAETMRTEAGEAVEHAETVTLNLAKKLAKSGQFFIYPDRVYIYRNPHGDGWMIELSAYHELSGHFKVNLPLYGQEHALFGSRCVVAGWIWGLMNVEDGRDRFMRDAGLQLRDALIRSLLGNSIDAWRGLASHRLPSRPKA